MTSVLPSRLAAAFSRPRGRLDELHPLGHPRRAGACWPLAISRASVAVVLRADGDPLAAAAGVDLRLDDDQAAAQRVVGRGGLLGRRSTTIPSGTATPAAFSSSFAWYSWTFIGGSGPACDERLSFDAPMPARHAEEFGFTTPDGRGVPDPARIGGRSWPGSGTRRVDLALDLGDLGVGREDESARPKASRVSGTSSTSRNVLEPEGRLLGRQAPRSRCGRLRADVAGEPAAARLRVVDPVQEVVGRERPWPCAGWPPGGSGGRRRRRSASWGSSAWAIRSLDPRVGVLVVDGEEDGRSP